MGVIYVFPTDGLPQNVEMEWDIFTDKMRKVPAATVDQAGSLPVTLEEGYEILRWENFLRFPELPTLAAIERPPTAIQRAAAWGRFVGVAAFILFLGLLLRRYRREKAFSGPLTAASVLAALVAVSSSYQYRQSSLDQEQLEQLVNDLLHNVYRAFDYRGEEVIYDVLEKSVSGELLTDIYLETQKGLELANQGGARVKVKSTEVQSAELLSRTGNQLNIESNWNVGGSVGHWGHVHQRSNSYRANLQISEIDGAWKLTGLEILEEQRL